MMDSSLRLQVRVQIEKTDTTAIMVRDDLPSAKMEFTLQNGFSGYPVRLGGNFSYTLAWSKDIPRVVVLESDGIEKYVRPEVDLQEKNRI